MRTAHALSIGVAVVCSLVISCSPAPGTDTWRLIETGPLSADDTAEFAADHLIHVPSTFLAVDTDDSGAVVVWRSPDGERWTPSTPTAFIPPPDGTQYDVRHLVSLGDGAVAIGTASTPTSQARAVAWASPDGESWTLDDTLSQATIRTVNLGFGGAAVAGEDVYFFAGDSDYYQRDPTGRWTHHPLPQGCSAGTEEVESTTDLGVMVLGAEISDGDGPYASSSSAVVCAVRPDGTVHDFSARVGLTWASSATSTGGSTYIVGYPPGPTPEVSGPPAVVSTDDDGTTWSTPRPLPVPDGYTVAGEIRTITSTERGLMVTGVVLGDGAVTIPAVWTSTDQGETWTGQALPPLGQQGYLGDVARDGDRVLMLALVGYYPTYTAGIMTNA